MVKSQQEVEQLFDSSGERDKIKKILEQKLRDDGWEKKIEELAREAANKALRENGDTNTEEIYNQLKGQARSMVTNDTKTAIFELVRDWVCKKYGIEWFRAIFDVAVDIRPGSATYGQWHGVILNGKNKHAFWIPEGFLHGFQCLSPEGAHITYKCTGVYDPKSEYGINPFDTDINVAWPITEKEKIVVSERDTQHKDLKDLQQ